MIRKLILNIITILNILLLIFVKFFNQKIFKKNILLVKFGKLGDMFILLRLLDEIEISLISKKIFLCIPKEYEEVFANLKNIEIIPSISFRKFNIFKILEFIRRIKKEKISNTIILGGSRSPIEEDFISSVLGFTEVNATNSDLTKTTNFSIFFENFFYDKILHTNTTLEYSLIRKQFQKFGFFFKKNNNFKISGNHIIIAPGASDEKRIWTANTLNLVIHNISIIFNRSKIEIIGSLRDFQQFYDIKNSYMGNKNITFNFQNNNFQSLKKIIEQSSLIICNDSGILHIAKYFNIKTILISGQGHFNRFAKYDNNYLFKKIPCANCLWKCKYQLENKRYKCVNELEQNISDVDFKELLSRT